VLVSVHDPVYLVIRTKEILLFLRADAENGWEMRLDPTPIPTGSPSLNHNASSFSVALIGGLFPVTRCPMCGRAAVWEDACTPGRNFSTVSP